MRKKTSKSQASSLKWAYPNIVGALQGEFHDVGRGVVEETVGRGVARSRILRRFAGGTLRVADGNKQHSKRSDPYEHFS